jgi:hypothetical protein
MAFAQNRGGRYILGKEKPERVKRGNDQLQDAGGTRRVTRPFPPGDALPGYPDAKKAPPKTTRAGGGRRTRWKTADGTILERDYLHNTVEIYDASGRRHLGDFDPWDGRQVGNPDSRRSVEP